MGTLVGLRVLVGLGVRLVEGVDVWLAVGAMVGLVVGFKSLAEVADLGLPLVG